jgi:tetratricopeptide (TPR) repeat protein
MPRHKFSLSDVLRYEDRVAIEENEGESVHQVANQLQPIAQGSAPKLDRAQRNMPVDADSIDRLVRSPAPMTLGGALEEKRKVAIFEVSDRRKSDSVIYLDDAPTAEDSLGLGDTIRLVTSLISSLKTGTPFVLGIDGTWGSGKTSLCYAVERRLREIPGCVTCWVNAWRFETVTQLATALVLALRYDIFDRYQSVQHQIDDPEGCEDQLAELTRRAADGELWLDGGTETHFENLLFSLLPKDRIHQARCVVFLDDLDRCSPKQLDAALKLLRPLTAAWGMVVVLPCDRARVRATLKQNPEIMEPVADNSLAGDSSNAHGVDAYLERIVRVWLAMPTPRRDAISHYLREKLAAVHDKQSISSAYVDLVADIVDGNPRRFKSMVTAFNLTYQLVQSTEPTSHTIQERLYTYGLGPGNARFKDFVFKVFLLRHFWPEQFIIFREIPQSLLDVQRLALLLSQSGSATGVADDTETFVQRCLTDRWLVRLFALQPTFEPGLKLNDSEWVEPVDELMQAAMLCPPAVNKAPSPLQVYETLQRVEPEMRRSFANAMHDADPLGAQFIFTILRPTDEHKAEAAVQATVTPIYQQPSARKADAPPIRESVEAALGGALSPELSTPRGALAPQGSAASDRDLEPDDVSPDEARDLLNQMLLQAQAGQANPENFAQPPVDQMDFGDILIAIQRLWIAGRLARINHDRTNLRKLATQVRETVRRAYQLKSSGEVGDPEDVTKVTLVLGNIAVTYEVAGEANLAEEFYRDAIGLDPEFGGVHLQYSDFLADRNRLEEATEQLELGKKYEPDNRLVPAVQSKIALKRAGHDKSSLNELRDAFENNPNNSAVAAAYLLALSELPVEEGSAEFERVCRVWGDALPEDNKSDARRALADYYATHNRRPDAIKIYNEILPKLIDREDRRATLHNLATLEASAGERTNALAHWTEAYNLNRNDQQVVTAFVTALINWNMYEQARKVTNGEPLTPADASPDDTP